MIIPLSKELRIRGTDQCQQLETPRIHNGEMNLTIGSNKCQCADCGDFFLTVAAFEAHRVLASASPSYRRSCATPLTHNWSLERDAKGFWRLPVREFPEGAKKRQATSTCGSNPHPPAVWRQGVSGVAA